MKIFWIVLLLIIAFISTFFIPVTRSKEFVIKNNFDNTLSQLSNAKNWEKWHPVVKSITNNNFSTFSHDSVLHHFKFVNGDDSLIAAEVNPLLYNVAQYYKNRNSFYDLQIIPLTNATNSITVRVIEKVPLIFYLLPALHSSEGEKSVTSLKSFLENPEDVYGYNMHVENVVDTVFATEMITIARKDFFKTLPEEFSKINAFIKMHVLTQTNFNSVSYLSTGDSMRLILGIPVNRFVQNNGKIKCVDIPKGRMLTGNYIGRFDERQKIYDAFKKYLHDHSMENVGATFESYYDNKLPSSDSDLVKFKFYYPIL